MSITFEWSLNKTAKEAYLISCRKSFSHLEQQKTTKNYVLTTYTWLPINVRVWVGFFYLFVVYLRIENNSFWFFLALFRTTFWEKSESKFGIFSRESFEESKNGENPPQKLSLLGIFAFVGLKWSPFFDSFSSRQIRLFKLSRQKLLVVMNNASSCSKTHIQDFLWIDSF